MAGGILLLFLVYVVVVAAVVSGVALVVTVDPSVAVSVDVRSEDSGFAAEGSGNSASDRRLPRLGYKKRARFIFSRSFFLKRKNCEKPPRVQSLFFCLAHLLLYTFARPSQTTSDDDPGSVPLSPSRIRKERL